MSNDRGLQDPQSLAFLAMVQLGSSGTAPVGNHTPDLGGVNLLANGPWLQELGRQVVSDAVAPDSAALMSLFPAGKQLVIDIYGSTAMGGNSLYTQPFNVVAGTQPLLPLTISTYAAESDPGPAPFFPHMSIEGWWSPEGVPPTPGAIGGDFHGLVMQRDEVGGGVARLFEYYQVDTSDGGSTWLSVGGAQFDLTTGSPRPEGWTSADAGGLPMQPLLLRYDEAALGAIHHPIRAIIGPTQSRIASVWPARHVVYSGSRTTG